MATLFVYGIAQDTQRTIATIRDLQSAMPAVPEVPSGYTLQSDGASVQVWFGDPDTNHHQVKLISGYGTEKQQFNSVKQAIDAFLKLAKNTLD